MNCILVALILKFWFWSTKPLVFLQKVLQIMKETLKFFVSKPCWQTPTTKIWFFINNGDSYHRKLRKTKTTRFGRRSQCLGCWVLVKSRRFLPSPRDWLLQKYSFHVLLLHLSQDLGLKLKKRRLGQKGLRLASLLYYSTIQKCLQAPSICFL